MRSSAIESHRALAQQVTVTEVSLVVDLADGRTITAPLAWYPRLWHATPAERTRWRLLGKGEGVHWPDLDEDISVESLVRGQPSAESADSLGRWLAARARPAQAPDPPARPPSSL